MGGSVWTDCTGTTGKAERSPVTRKARAFRAARFGAFWKMELAGFGSAPRRAYPGSILEKETFRNYDVSDGLQSNEFSDGCYQEPGWGDVLWRQQWVQCIFP